MHFLFTFISLISLTPTVDSTRVYDIPAVTVSASIKQTEAYSEQPVASTSFIPSDFESGRITEPKNLSLSVPNLIIADYGSKMTSSIYVRGIGSRMEQPAMGLYVDNVPILNKNNYDFDYFDIQSIDVLRGPQGTLYGRNTIGGIMEVHTLSPSDYQGTRVRAEYGNGNTSTVKVATYHKPTDKFAFSVALNQHYSDGYFTNEYDGSAADRISSQGGRIKVQAALALRWSMENVLTLNNVKQKGFAYALYDEYTGKTMSINHNDPCKYDRFGLTDGLTFSYNADNFTISSTTSYQYTDDDMVLDQDFRPLSLFTLLQSQKENAVTQEFVARSNSNKRWQWTSGLFGFWKKVDMSSPVTFKRDGIDQLILANANAGIHSFMPDADLLIRDEFPIESDFRLPVYGASAYHQSGFTAGRWKFVAGLRADFEKTSIKYTNSATVNYRFTMTMDDYKPLPVQMSGKQNKSFFEIMPKAAVMYETGKGKIYATVARGYKAGGFNTQIFSDILQNKIMGDMMKDLGIYFNGYDPTYDAATAISYKPEYSWNYEVGAHLRLFEGRLFVDAALFYIDCRDQQLTVFPSGKSTGRLMSNAGQTRSYGAELAATYSYKNFRLTAAYGHTNAKFITYESGNEDYSGKYVPYSPQNTVSVNCGYKWYTYKKWLDHISFDVYWQGAGRIYWNESNTISQPFYGLLNATVSVQKNGYTLGIWGKNLTETDYNTFYFKSVGNSFVQRGKPLQFGFFINVNI